MKSTLSGIVPEYIGVDLTDRYSRQCRAIDVCGLTLTVANRLNASFWQWCWDPASQSLDVAAIAEELRRARVAMVDGPQALAQAGNTMRVCERRSAAAAKTPDVRPNLGKRTPFGGFICSSLDLFDRLRHAEFAISPLVFRGGVFEVYPALMWSILSSRGGRLPKKSTRPGRLSRKYILEALGVSGLPVCPTPDENDACVAALLAASADGQVPGVTAERIGSPLSIDGDGILREGPIIIPKLDGSVMDHIAALLTSVHLRSQDSGVQLAMPISRAHTDPNELLKSFVDKAGRGNPEVCTYAWAYRKLFEASSERRFSLSHVWKVIDMARSTEPRELPRLGLVRLDTFIVSKKTGRPGDGYWLTAQHDREAWTRTLGNATMLT